MVFTEQRPLGCSRCRYGKTGCSRCRNPAFKSRAVRQQLLAEGKPTQRVAEANDSSLLSTSHDTDSNDVIPRYTSASRRSKRASGRPSKFEERKAANSRTQQQQQGPSTRATAHETLKRQQQTTAYAAQGHQQQQQQQQNFTVAATRGCCEQQQQQQQSHRVQQQYGPSELQQHTQQQQQQQQQQHHTTVHTIATRGPLRRSNKHLITSDTDINIVKRLRKALQPLSTPSAAAADAAAPAVGVQAAEQAVVPAEDHAALPSSDTAAAAAAAAAAATAGLGSGRSAFGDDDRHFVADGGARKADAAAAAAAEEGVITPFDLDQAATATIAAAAAGPADFNRLLQQRIQQQLSQGRQPLLPTKRSAAAAAAGSSPVATKHSRRAGTPIQQQQQQVADLLSSSPLSPLSPAAAAAAAAQVINSSSSADSAPLTTAALTPSPQTLPTKRQKHKTLTPKTTKPYRPPKPYTHLALPGVNPRVCVPGWSPPVSPYGLLEEELWQDPWKLLLACMLLNKTSGKQVRIVLWDLLALCPTPEAAAAADTNAIRDIIYPLGLYNKRAVAVQRLSHDFIHKNWRCPTELYGIGKYAADAYYIFCRGLWQGVQPDDKDLIKYHEWLRATGGLGTGLTGANVGPSQ